MRKFFILLLFFPLLCLGQTDDMPGLPKVIPVSPTVANLGIFGEVPVGLSSGLPNISIPISKIEYGDITVPISLDYHASGVKIKDRSGLCGVKWALNAGGQIKVDKFTPQTKTNQYIGSLNEFDALTNNEKFTLFSSSSPITYEPEHYSYMLPNGSGQFYVNGNNDILHVPKKDYIKIEGIGVEGAGGDKIITNENGVKYFFGLNDFNSVEWTSVFYNSSFYNPHFYDGDLPCCSNIEGGSSSVDNNPTAYFLDKIESPRGFKVHFEYETNNISYQNEVLSQNEYLQNQLYGTIGNEPQKTIATLTTFLSKRLKKIYYANAEILFNYLESNDLTHNNDNGGQLSEIIIKNNNIVLKRYEILYSYNGRYNISQVNIYDAANNKVSDYQIEYQGGTIPGTNSTAMDFYGFYNGKYNNSSLVPYYKFLNKIYGDADRRANIDFSKIGLIKSIKYPTGGKTSFEFESNTASNIPEFLTKLPTRSEFTKNFYYTIDGYDTANTTLKDNFTIPDNKVTSFPTVITISGTDYTNNYGNNPTFYSYPFTLTNTNTGQVYYLYNNTSGPQYNSYQKLGSAGFKYTYNYDLPPGNYDLSLYHDSRDYRFTLTVTWKELIENEGSNSYIDIAGGHRIKSIKNFDSDGSLALEKKYTYEDGYLNFYSTFYLEEQTVNYTTSFTNIYGDTCYDDNGSVKRFHISSGPIRDGGLSSHLISYGTVTEDLSGNGYTKYHFSNEFDDVDDPAKKYAPLTNNSYKRGRVKEKWIYNKNDVLQQYESFEYLDETINDELLYGVLFNRENRLGGDSKKYLSEVTIPAYPGVNCSIPTSFYYSYELYSISSNYVELSQHETTQYFAAGTSLKTIISNSYNNKKLLQATVVSNSENEYLKTIYLYPYDLIAIEQSPYMQQLEEANRVASPIIVYKYTLDSQNEETKLSEQHTKYGLSDDTGNILLPIELYYKKGTGSINLNNTDDRIVELKKYDDRGNLLEVKKSNGSSVVYLWGYNQQYPIAKIENDTLNSVVSALGQSISQINEIDLTLINNLRSNVNFSNSMITTYTYDPLIGMTSMTDPRGYKTMYEYDDFERLEQVTDAEGHILSENQYHYQSQN